VGLQSHDTRLDRDVALKFLPSHPAISEQESSFLQEAQAAAAMHHPNICSTIDIQEHDKWKFIVMEFIEGKELRSPIKETSLLFEQILQFAVRSLPVCKPHNKGSYIAISSHRTS
jgi:serine/threonine protein kinase